MRCSMREPVMFTSTPIQKLQKKKEFINLENSPIPKLYKNGTEIPEQLIRYQDQRKHSITIFKVLGNQKMPLFDNERKEAVVLKKKVHPRMVVGSDSEEEDKIYEEITSLQSMLSKSLINPSSSAKAAYKNMDAEQHKSNKQIRSRSKAKPLKEDISEPESKKSMRRISRVATIVDEVMKERMSTIGRSPMAKSEANVDTVVREGTSDVISRRFTRSRTTAMPLGDTNFVRESQQRKPSFSAEIDVKTEVETEVLTNLKTTGEKKTRKIRKRTKNIVIKSEEKENDIPPYDDDPQPGGQALIPLKINNLNNILKKDEAAVRKSASIEKILNTDKKQSFIGEQFDKEKPVIYKQDSIKDNKWMQVTGQKGVFLVNNFFINNISNGFIKIENKCFLNLNSRKFQIFHVVDGRGIFSYNDIKDKVAPGQTITIPSGVSCEIRNTGIKKNMILSFTKVCGE